jgi:two-component system phosphate regulon sensor histidine kinase PhoR
MTQTSAVNAHNAELERERLTSLINSMADGVIAIDEKTHIVVYNGAALNILDVNSTISGKTISSVMKLVDKTGQAISLKDIILETKTQSTSRDWKLQYPDGSAINLYTSIAPVKLGYGQAGMSGYVILVRDITREKSLEEERDEFISVVSHELRTPIAIAEGNIGNAEFILEKTGDLKQAKEALAQAHDQVNFLSGMINDLSTLSRAERGKLQVDIEDINTYELIEELGRLYSPEASAKGLKLFTEPDRDLELLKSSRLYVREILQNFVTNAVKYTEEGHITIGASKRDGGVVFTISDTGIGLSKADQERIFDKFWRSEDYRTRKNNGTGLGLYVTMKLTRLIKAEIEVQSELNRGSTFSIFVPNLT